LACLLRRSRSCPRAPSPLVVLVCGCLVACELWGGGLVVGEASRLSAGCVGLLAGVLVVVMRSGVLLCCSCWLASVGVWWLLACAAGEGCAGIAGTAGNTCSTCSTCSAGILGVVPRVCAVLVHYFYK